MYCLLHLLPLPLLHHLNLVCFIDVTLDFILSLILYVLLLLRRKMTRVCCRLPSCSVVPLSLPEKRFVHLPPSSSSPHLFPTSDSVRNFPVTSGSVTAERFGCRCRFCLRLCRSLRFAFRHRLCLEFGDRFLRRVRLVPSSSKSSMRFSPSAGFALVLPAVGFALLGSFHHCSRSSMFFSRGHRTRVALLHSSRHKLVGCGSVSDSLTTGSLAAVSSLIPPASLCGGLRLRGPLLASSTTAQHCATSCLLVRGRRTRSLPQRVLLTMRIGSSFARYFSFTCSAEMFVPLFTGCVHLMK